MDDKRSADTLESAGKGFADEGLRVFTGSHCRSISYRVEVKGDEFRTDEFVAGTGAYQQKGSITNVVCAPKYSGSDFHLHISWSIRKKVSVFLEFARGKIKAAPDEHEPYAEEFLPWLEKFFVPKVLEANVHAEFTYPRSVRESKFTLPLKASIGPKASDVVIDGVSFRLSPAVDGVSKIWVNQEPEKIWAHIYAVRKIDIRATDRPKKDIQALADVLDTVLEEPVDDSHSRTSGKV